MCQLFAYGKQNYLGYMLVSEDYKTICYDNEDRYIGKLLESDQHIFVFDKNEHYIGHYDGTYTYNKSNRIISKGNYTYDLLYPALETIR